MNQTPADPDYAIAPPPRKSRRLWWTLGIILVVAILLGTCVKGGIDAFAATSARADASKVFAQQAMTQGLPVADDPVYARRAMVTQEGVDSANRYIRQFGAVSDFTDPVCQIHSAANTNPDESGTFANCGLSATAEHSPVNIAIRWVREDETWKLLAFEADFPDQSVLLDKAEALDRLSNEEGDSVQEPPSEIIAPE